MQLGFNGDLNTGRQEQPINFAGDSDRRSKSGPDLPSPHLLNAAIGSVIMDQIMASEYNQGMVLLKCVKLLFSEV
ncbi:hypothetical protein L6452_13894 [Arctium lappa]|uniref:Uncharacterized protein n=1 Tax=Arctium lappa TaxID=4217 RepID=A0ACB9CJK8_ARCLA|nr:hypothetical protein L6452_13894 [Arctium lappa]